MRVFYIFNIKPEIRELYTDNYLVLYSVLKQLYNLNKLNIDYGYSLYRQLINSIDKLELDNFLFLKLHQDAPYSKRNNKHIINNLYKDEISVLEVKRAYIKIEAEQNAISFFNILYMYNDYFVCDFETGDYFFLNDINSTCLIS